MPRPAPARDARGHAADDARQALRPAGADTVLVLVPGGTYNSTYWDSPFDGGSRSFSKAANRAGYATLTVDRLGTGASSKPPSLLVTATGQAHAVHEVVQAMRAGTHGPAFPKVVVGGHSLGAAIAILEAGTYRDVDGLLVTAMAHRLNTLGALPVFTSLVPAVLDPKFGGLDGYLTTQVGARYEPFHRPGVRDEALLALEESTKDVVAPPRCSTAR
ncbi:alpha/beta hydrolase [Actinokineospora soli]|uniref:Alpha/beta hydrolase n=1 Tax=Actinokineospora soli TaxID=1048753 RepID=A0ABW2TT65_9PSEU